LQDIALTEKSHPQRGQIALEEALVDHPFTQGIPRQLLRRLASLAHEVSFGEDEIVFRAGERSVNFLLLTQGSVCVEVSTPVYGMTIQILTAGDAFGWSALMDQHHTVFQVRAREPSTALCLDGHRLIEACQKDDRLAAEIFHRVAEVLARRVSATEIRLAEFCGSARPNSADRNESSNEQR
jgi:CRP-like cAMP-binding protein